MRGSGATHYPCRTPAADGRIVKPHQHRFLDLALARNVLRFGQFTLKSGRVSPYFFNAGRFDSGAALSELGSCYAEALLDAGLEFDMLFGPAYKGIPLATAVAVALAARGRDVPLAYNRKEAKAHGEGGMLVGAPLAGRVLVVDDVITAGTAIREAIALIGAAGATVCGVLVALDREERGSGPQSASQEVASEFGIPVVCVARLGDLLSYTDQNPDLQPHREAMHAYRDRYGID
jgi:orotate phosphoribosyltransferase